MWKKEIDLTVKTGTYIGKDMTTKYNNENVGKILSDGKGNKILLFKRSFNTAAVLQEPGKDGHISNYFTVQMWNVNDEDDHQEEERVAIKRPADKYKKSVDMDDDIPF